MENIEDKIPETDVKTESNHAQTAESESAPRTALEFEYTDEIGGLTFNEEVPIVSPAEAESAAEASVTEPVKPKQKKKPEPTVLKDEFVLPVGFRSVAKADGSTDDDSVYRVKATYVPTFTGAVDKYRIKGAPRLVDTNAQKEGSNEKIKPVEERTSASELDPTAEIGGSGRVERVILSAGSDRIEEPKDENITIYKFKSQDENDSERHTVPTTEELMADIAEKTRQEPVTESEQIAEEPELGERGEYHMPDPTEPNSSDRAYTSSYMTAEEAPKGALTEIDKKNMISAPEQRDAVKDSYLDSLIAARIRLFTAALLLVGAFLFEFFSSQILNFLGFGGSAVATLLLDFQICLCMLLLCLPEIMRALRYLVKGNFVPELMLLLSAVAVSLYTLIAVLTGASVLMHFSILFGVQVFIGIVGSLCKIKADFAVFKLATKSEVKSVVDIRRTRDLPGENIALDGAVDEFKSLTARVFETGCVADFKKNTENNSENSVNVITVLSMSFGVALVAAVVSYFVSGWSLINAANTFALVVLLSGPSASLLLHKLPFLHASREASEDSCGFVGERAIVECAGVDVLCYNDTDVFGTEDVGIRQVHLYGKAYNMAKAMNEMYALFSVAGGPLRHVFASALDRKCEPAVNVEIEADGISGVVNGYTALAGTEEYMLRHGIAVPNAGAKVKSGASDSTRVMYGASDGEVYVRFLIRYSFSEEFSMLLPHLKSNKIVPLIYTCDPNINLELIRVLTFGEDIIRIRKRNVPDTAAKRYYPHISSPVVSLGDKTDIFGMLTLGKKYCAFQSYASTAELITALLGAIGGVVLSLSGMFSVPVAALAVWQFVLSVAVFIKSKLTFSTRKKEKGNG